MLFVSWMLGWLFWHAFKGAAFKQQILELENQLTGLRTIESSLKNEIGNINFEKEKIYSDYLEKRDAFNTLELNYNSLVAEKQELEEQLSDTNQAQIPQAEYELLKSNYAKLQGEIKEKRRIQIGLAQQDFDVLRLKLAKAEKEIATLKNQEREIVEKIIYVEKDKPGKAPDAHVAPPLKFEDHIEQDNGGNGRPFDDEEEEIEISEAEHNTLLDEQKFDYAKIFKTDNFQIIEGIGPIIENLLQNDGLKNWVALAASDHEKLHQILDKAGPRFKIHDPVSWSKQASFATKGNWDGLIKYQRFLCSQKETGKNQEKTLAKIEKLAIRMLEAQKVRQDDLKVIEGIGIKTEALLYSAGISSWRQLAQTPSESLEKILINAGADFKDIAPRNWQKQAEMAASNHWDALKKFQDENLLE